MKELYGAEVVLTGDIDRSERFGYYEDIRGGEAFVFSVTTRQLDTVPVIASPVNFEADEMYIFEELEELQDGEEVSFAGYPVIIDNELYIDMDGIPFLPEE